MQVQDVVGLTLVSGLITFLIGAGAWRLQYEKPLLEALRVIHDDRRRRAWIHLWMIPAMFVTSAGVAGYAAIPGAGNPAAVFAAMAGAGPFNPPFWAHAYTGMLGVVLLVS